MLILEMQTGIASLRFSAAIVISFSLRVQSPRVSTRNGLKSSDQQELAEV